MPLWQGSFRHKVHTIARESQRSKWFWSLPVNLQAFYSWSKQNHQVHKNNWEEAESFRVLFVCICGKHFRAVSQLHFHFDCPHAAAFIFWFVRSLHSFICLFIFICSQVYYLDCLDFGLHIAGTGFPRSVSWRGDMIIEYSELDRKSKRCFGRRPMRKDLTSCYYNV